MKKYYIVVFILLCFGLYKIYNSQPTLEEMVGQMIMTGFHGDGTGRDQESFDAIEKQIKSGQIGGVVLYAADISGLKAKGFSSLQAKKQIFSSNIKNTEQVKQLNKHLQSIAPKKLLIAIDQEGGNIQRLRPEHGFISIPSAKQLAKYNPQKTYEIAKDLGERLFDLGINVNFAPLLDVDVNPNSPAIGVKERSFSSDPEIVTIYADAFAKGLDDSGLAYTFKHFPGHGSAVTDTHYGITDVTNTYQIYELKPWQNLLQNPSPKTMVMVAHVINNNFDTLPATLSYKTIQMLRNMGFDGVVISDSMDMIPIIGIYGIEKSVQMAIMAGNDILVFSNNLKFNKNRGSDINKMIVKMVKDGKIPKSRIKQSYRRIMNLKKHLK